MALNDYRCNECIIVERNYLHKPNCPFCGKPMEVTFEFWTGIEINPRYDERCDSKGFVKQFGLLDDPLASAQLGLGSQQLNSYGRLADDQKREFQERLKLDGDSSKLRKDVLEAYKKATGGKFEVQRD